MGLPPQYPSDVIALVVLWRLRYKLSLRDRFCRGYDELRNLLRPRSRPHQQTSANTRRLQFLRRTATVMSVLQAA